MGLGPFLDVAIGVLSIMAVFSLAASAIQEAIAEALRFRPRTLEEAVDGLLGALRAERGSGPSTAEFYAHPAIRTLMQGERKPSAIAARRYAETVLDLIGERRELAEAARREATQRAERAGAALEAIAAAAGRGHETAAVAALSLRESAQAVSAGLGAAERALEERIAALEAEWNDTMDRVSGWYARRTRAWLFWLGLLLAAGANVNLPDYALRTLTEAELQSRAAAYAAAVQADPAALASRPDLDALVEDLGQLGAVAGWRCSRRGEDEGASGFVALISAQVCEPGEAAPVPGATALIGWVMIGFGTSLGAQFWHQLLKQALALRTSGLLTGPPRRRPPQDA